MTQKTRAELLAELETIKRRNPDPYEWNAFIMNLIDSMVQTESKVFDYAFNSSDTQNSMLHYKPAAVGDLVQTLSYYKESSNNFAPAIWECYSLTPVDGIDNTSFVSGVGFIVEGLHARWRLVVNSLLDLWGVGVKCDGLATSQITRLNRLIQAISLKNARVSGSGILMVDSTITVDDAFFEAENLRLQAVSGYNGVVLNAQGGASTTDAMVLRAHGHGTPNGSWGLVNGANPGELAWSNVNLNSILFEIQNDNTGNSQYWLHAGYSGVACSLKGDTEKSDVHVYAVGCDTVLNEVNVGGTPDTNRVRISGTRCRCLFRSGNDNTIMIDFNFESAQDLGLSYTTSDGEVLADPRVLEENGKSSAYQGELRAHNGRLYFLIDRGAGGSSADGSDCAHFNNLRFADNVYGTLLYARRIQKLTGHLIARHVHNGRQNSNEGGSAGVGSIPCPSVHLGQVYQGDFRVTLSDCGNREGLRIGNAAYNLYPRNWTMGQNNIVMRSFNPRNGVFPTALNALVIEKMQGGCVPFGQIEGNISLEAGCDGVRIEVPAIWATRYTLTADDAATATIVIKGKLSSDDIFFKSWLRSGINVIVESLTDYGGARGTYFNGKWSVSGYPLAGTDSEFESITSNLNQLFKKRGLQAWKTADGQPYFASGDDPEDDWVDAVGANPVTPIYNPLSSALFARFSVQPSDARKNVYDRLFNDLDAAGLTSKLIFLYILGAHDEQAALLNVLSTSYNLTKNGSPIFTANAGFTGTTNTADYLATGYDATVSSGIMTINDAHLGVFALSDNSSGGMMGSLGPTSGRMKIRASAGGASMIGVNTTSNPGWTTTQSPPRHIIGNRVAAGSHQGYDNGALAVDSANGANSLPDEIFILKNSLGATGGQVFAAHLGVGLTTQEISDFYTLLNRCYNGILATA